MSYAWVITRDLFAEGEDEDSEIKSEVGTFGPSNMHQSVVDGVIRAGISFRLYDGDGEHMYTGKILHLQGPDACDFQPLRDFGTPNAGCTEIRYRNPGTGKWEAI